LGGFNLVIFCAASRTPNCSSWMADRVLMVRRWSGVANAVCWELILGEIQCPMHPTSRQFRSQTLPGRRNRLRICIPRNKPTRGRHCSPPLFTSFLDSSWGLMTVRRVVTAPSSVNLKTSFSNHAQIQRRLMGPACANPQRRRVPGGNRIGQKGSSSGWWP